ncbi:MAG: hypothetical protein QM538_03645 [Methylacidiphilales bacterium]|nr:hypothetical protein [Candidatus Methylacidiphilales bacterium]
MALEDFNDIKCRINNCLDYLDSDFIDLISDPRINKYSFRQRMYELLVCEYLIEKKCINKRPDGIPLNEGPDFHFDNTYIECVLPTQGESNSPDYLTTFDDKEPDDDGCWGTLFVDERAAKLRITNAIDAKLKQYQNWKNKPWFKPENQFVLFMNVFDIESGYLDTDHIPYLISILYGAILGYNMSTKEYYIDKKVIINKRKGSKVELGIFNKKDTHLDNPNPIAVICCSAINTSFPSQGLSSNNIINLYKYENIQIDQKLIRNNKLLSDITFHPAYVRYFAEYVNKI